MKQRINKNQAGAWLFLIFSVAYTACTFTVPLNIVLDDDFFTARTMPFYLGVMGMFFSVLQLLLEKGGREKTVPRITRVYHWKPVVGLLLAMLVYGLLFDELGFLLGTCLFLMAGFRILGEKRWILSLGIALTISVALWLVLTQFLGIHLESGELIIKLKELIV